ncbi:MAG: helix-turn-helix transcriptional regulator [Clostridium baratii]|uniref:helix-turn-helix domain-containing protein n=1 Tax=Clostridium baratii TaxID=1561 RepID=UPI00242DC7F8|nr:AraC family transcriptional regulator [Clostridium baratii]MBS6007090.1 helix-turn-helix transcriptional regulator [Clostridium baratii]MDU4910969.1 AraC family transcriptional regulator [Clostridium baratii]
MYNSYNNIDDYNPQILFVIDGKCSFDDEIPNTEYHCHDDFVELSFVTSGSVDYLIEGEKFTLKKGQVLISNPGVYHMELFNEQTNCTELHIGISNLSSSKGSNCIDIGDTNVITLNKYKDELLKCCSEIVDEQKGSKPSYPFMLKALVMKLLVLLDRELNEDINELIKHDISFKSREKKVIVENITEYLSKNYVKDISLETLSKNMYLSPVYISKIFKEIMGDSPINYLIKIRLSKAKELLNNSNTPIKTIAKMVGYNDPYYFSKLFKKYYGISPNKFKEKQKN